MCKRAFILLVILGLAGSAGAANIYVNAAATGSNNGTSWADAYVDLQSAMTAVSGDVIHVAEGSYTPGTATSSTYAPASGVTLLGGYSKDYPVIVPRNPNAYPTILDGDVNGDDVIYDVINDPSETIVVDAVANERADNIGHLMTITSGYANITVDGFVFIGGTCITSGYTGGGGIEVQSTCDTITIQNCQFYRNFGINCRGGSAVYVRGYNVLIQDCLFRQNATHSSKGALCCEGRYDTASTTINRCTFAHNVTMGAYFASAIGFEYRNNAIVNDCLFLENGGFKSSMTIYMQTNYAYDHSFVFSNCAFIGNTNFSRSVLMIQNGVDDPATLSCDVINCLFAKNVTGDTEPLGRGGAAIGIIPIDSGVFTVNIANCTIADNQDLSGDRPAVWHVSDTKNCDTLSLKNNIIWGNKGSQTNCSFGGWDTAKTGTCIVNYNCISTADPNDYLPAGSVGNMMADPLFVNPAIGDYHVQSTSPCIDKGDPASAYANEPKWLNGCRVNMGAYGNTAEAATTATCVALTADITGDCKVTTADLLQLRAQWLKTCP